MNPSRDIEKLFDQFGGNAADYQEIGRETEARNARTRWPLLATLDLSQPSIPNIAPRRDSLLPQTRDRSSGTNNAASQLTQPQSATPINRGKPPLFARAHRRTIPPVANVTLPAATLGAARFSALVESVETVSEAAVPVAAPAPVVTEPTAALAPAFGAPRTPAASVLGGAAAVSPTAPAAPSLRSAPPANKPSLPRLDSTAAPQPKAPSTPSILGQLFKAPAAPLAQPTADANPGSLQSMFDRLRAPAERVDATKNTGSWLAGRTARS
jgi:hypothetical protein